MTSGPAAMMRDQMPATVYFTPPGTAEPLQEPAIQYTQTQHTSLDVTPPAENLQ